MSTKTFFFFTAWSAYIGDGIDVLVQDVNTTFLGNTTLCRNPYFAKEVFLGSSSSDSNLNWWELWISTGLLATLLEKTCVANFCVATLFLEDPLSKCGGQYEGPPSHHAFGNSFSMYELKAMCEQNLQMVAARKAILWGGLANLFLLNIVASNMHSNNGSDVSSGSCAFLIGLAFVPPALTYWSKKVTDEKINRIKNQWTGLGEA